MIVPIEKEYSRIESQRNKILDDIQQLNHEQQNFKPEPGKWSILQVFVHLITAERNALMYMNKKILGIDASPKAGFSAMLRSFALNHGLKLPIKYKAPKVALPEFEDIYFFENVRKEWDETRGELKKLLDQLEFKHEKKLIFKHPMVGKINIHQALSFYFEHLDHHSKQIERIKNHSEFPRK